MSAMLQERCDCEDPPHPQQCTNHRIPTRARPQRTPTQYLPSSDLPAASVAGWDQAPLRRGELAESSKIRNFKNEKVGKEVRQQNRMLIHCMLGTLIACRRFSSIKKKKRKIMPGLMQGRAENYSFHSGFLFRQTSTEDTFSDSFALIMDEINQCYSHSGNKALYMIKIGRVARKICSNYIMEL